ncbi:PREDICTED: proline-rich membrane anchor 1 [Acanthisitta chloris]|uniref:proline-rich membrane anchor 1 n=1 Tax=Acanthisitta chloris TaxID=57068 RepID=UPI0004F0D105|nr:PREDICTED: proline-rich membrane anchor 1 [Acanthisitta chloris]
MELTFFGSPERWETYFAVGGKMHGKRQWRSRESRRSNFGRALPWGFGVDCELRILCPGIYEMTVYSLPGDKRQLSPLGAQLWVVGEVHWLCWGLGITQGEPQKSCSKPVADKVTESCQEICQCRPPPLLPPPPPPPPPPRLLAVPTPKSTFCPTEETWWPGLVIIIAVCCATLVFLFVVVIICYKAIKRKPMRKEENGTSRAEYAMTSSQNNKTVDNNAVV